MWVHLFLSITTLKSQESRHNKPHTTHGQNFSSNNFLLWWKLWRCWAPPLPLKFSPANKNNDGYVALSHWITKAIPKEKKISLGNVVIFIPFITYLLWLLFSSPPSSAEQKSRCLLIMAQGKVQHTGSVSSRSIYGCYKNFAKNTLSVLNSSKNKRHFNS